VLRLEQVSYRYPGADHVTLHGITLELAEGSVTGLAGASGAGKSTLCLVAGGLAPRTVGGRLTGSLSIDGVDVARWPMHRLSEQVVTGLQHPSAQLSLVADTVFDEVAFGAANLGLPRGEVMERSAEALRQTDIEGLAGRDPRRLSGGQQQLVVIAGLLAMRPRFLVLDEPVAHLDDRSSKAILDAISRVAVAGTAVLLAEQRSAALIDVCDSVAVLAGGNIVSHGPALEVLSDPITTALGIEELPGVRLRRRLSEAGFDAELAALEPEA
jgi:energy-coupling factor transporter ATP-binding protein EcfA2